MNLLPLVLLAAGAASTPDAAPDLPRVLFLTHSAGFEHPVVKRPSPDALSHAEAAFVDMTRGAYDVVATQECAALTAETLVDLDVVVFCTTGELPLGSGVFDALMDWILGGGAFVGVHCASDTFYASPPYLAMVGGTFDGHPWHEEVVLDVHAGVAGGGRHPAVAGLGDTWTLTDEIYQFRDHPLEPLRLLLTLDPASADVSLGKRADGVYANAWWRDWGEGRVFYTALGHREAVWDSEAFRAHLLGGLRWALEGPDLPAPVPDGAVVLLDAAGRPAPDAWTHRGGGPFAWRAPPASDVLGAQAVPGSGDLVSTASFGDALLHVEFATPHEPDDEGQARGNSGVYVQGRYEVQVLDSHGLPAGLDRCAAIYGKKAPDVVASRPPGRWQTYDIRFTAPRFDDTGGKTADARLTVWHDGVLVHDDVAVDGPTLAGLGTDEVARGPLLLQDHGDAVRYRNVWVLPTR